MIKLDRHIEILLLDNDCVIVPGFGGFVSHHIEAHWDSRDNMYLPPLRTLGFNSQLILNDSLLAQSYVDAYDMSYPEALTEIEDEVEKLRHEIDFNGFFDMHGLGRLCKDAVGKYVFAPNESGILTPEFYGLGGVEVPLIEESQRDGTLDEASVPSQPKTVSIKLSTLRKVAAACVVAIVLWMLPSPLANSDSRILKGGINAEMIYKMMPKSMTKGKPEIKVDIKKKESRQETKGSLSHADSSVQPEKNVEKWAIVLACALPESNAMRYKNELTQKGITDLHVLLSGKNSKVMCGKYDNRESAQEALRTLQQRMPGTAGWITSLK